MLKKIVTYGIECIITDDGRIMPVLHPDEYGHIKPYRLKRDAGKMMKRVLKICKTHTIADDPYIGLRKFIIVKNTREIVWRDPAR